MVSGRDDSFQRSLGYSTLTYRVSPRLLRERGSPLCEGLPGIALHIRTRLPSLFENFMCVEGQPLIQIFLSEGPGFWCADFRAFGNRREGPGVPEVEWSAESIARSFTADGHRAI